jgi:predicted adenine nucleotide alpha hydrolase (AANH) superfamily ATPase
MKLLLHICCAPCAVYPYRSLKEEGVSLTGFFYNPNIHPFLEFRKRFECFEEWAEDENLKCIVRDDYGLEDFLRMVTFREAERCRLCYLMRFEAAAAVAGKGKFEAFTTTLLYSRFQKHDLIRETAFAAAEKFGVRFYYEDFRAGWKDGIRLSKEKNLYRQQYCGCIYSEWERYRHLARIIHKPQ